MTEPKKLFAPVWKHLFLEIAIGAIAIPVITTIYMIVTRGVESWWLGLLVGAAFGLLAFAFYTRRFRRRAPRLVEIDADGIVVHGRDETVTRLEWDRAERAEHESSYGLRWRFGSDEDAPLLMLRDDGFSAAQWDEISGEIRRHCERHGVELDVEALEQFGETPEER